MKETAGNMGISSIRPFHGCIDSIEDPVAYIEDIEYTVEIEVCVEGTATDKHHWVLFCQNL